MNLSCIPTFNFFDTSEFLTSAMHCVTVIVTPIHLLGLYCILFKTPDQMEGVKWYLLNMHISVMAFDYSVTVLSIPFVLATKLAGFSLGILKHLNLPFIIPAITIIYSFGLISIAIVAIFEKQFRVNCSFSWMTKWVSMKPFFLPSHYIVHACMMVGVILFVPNQEAVIKDLFKNLPCLPREIYEAPIFALADNVTYHLITMSVGIAFVTFELLFFLICLIFNCLKQLKEHRMSRRTFRLQRQFLVAIIVQSGVPMIFFILPLFYFIVAFIKQYYNQGVINCLIVNASLHGMVSTLAMLSLHKPYRQAIKDMFGRSPQQKTEVSKISKAVLL